MNQRDVGGTIAGHRQLFMNHGVFDSVMMIVDSSVSAVPHDCPVPHLPRYSYFIKLHKVSIGLIVDADCSRESGQAVTAHSSVAGLTATD